MPDIKLKKVWREMHHRCKTITRKDYKDYGGRGITVCEAWDAWYTFEKWALNNSYKEGLQLDRQHNNYGYCPDNCQWVGYTEQSVNKRKYKNNTSGFKGVSFNNRTSKFMTYIQVDGKRKHLGSFNSAIEAANSRDQFIIKNNMARTLLSNPD